MPRLGKMSPMVSSVLLSLCCAQLVVAVGGNSLPTLAVQLLPPKDALPEAKGSLVSLA